MDRSDLIASLRENSPRDRIITAVDVPDIDSAIELAASLGSAGGFVKVGMELFTAAGPAAIAAMTAAGKEVFLDLKYMDIPNTVAGAVRSAAGLGVSMLTLHAHGGRRMLSAAAAAARAAPVGPLGRRPALLAVTVLTSFSPEEYAEVAPGNETLSDRIIRLARLARDSGCDGVVCSPTDLPALRDAIGYDLLAVTPGVRPASAATDDQRRTTTPAAAMAAGADFLVIGRPITRAPDPGAALLEIRKELSPR